MYKPAGILKLYGVTLTPTKLRMSNTIIAFFILIQFLFGLDCGFVNWFNKNYRSFLKLVFLAVTSWVLLVNLILVKQINRTTAWWILLSLFDYVSSVLVLKFSKLNVYDFLIKINLVCSKTDRKSNEIIGAIGIIYMTIVLVTKVVISIFYCAEVPSEPCDEYGLPLIIVALYSFCTSDIVPVIMIIIVYHELRSVMNMRQTFKKQQINVDAMKKLYIAVANVIDGIRPLYHNMLIVKLIVELPKLLTTMYYFVHFIKIEAALVTFAGQFIFILYAVLQIIVPAIVAEMIKVKVEEIKLELHNLVMAREDDVKLRADVQSLLSYMEVRRLQYHAWRIVPVDLRLPVSLCGLCTTYFLVILQFTHLVD